MCFPRVVRSEAVAQVSGFLWLIVGVFLIGAGALVAWVTQPAESYGGTFGGAHPKHAWLDRITLGLWIVAGATLLVCGFIALIVYPSRAVGRTTCRNWASQTGYETKFTILNWADTGTCLARVPGGRWVQNSRVIINAPVKP